MLSGAVRGHAAAPRGGRGTQIQEGEASERRNARAAGHRKLLLERQQHDHGRKRQEPQGSPRGPPQPGDPPFPGERNEHRGVRRLRGLLWVGGRRTAGVAQAGRGRPKSRRSDTRHCRRPDRRRGAVHGRGAAVGILVPVRGDGLRDHIGGREEGVSAEAYETAARCRRGRNGTSRVLVRIRFDDD